MLHSYENKRRKEGTYMTNVRKRLVLNTCADEEAAKVRKMDECGCFNWMPKMSEIREKIAFWL